MKRATPHDLIDRLHRRSLAALREIFLEVVLEPAAVPAARDAVERIDGCRIDDDRTGLPHVADRLHEHRDHFAVGARTFVRLSQYADPRALESSRYDKLVVVGLSMLIRGGRNGIVWI